MLAVNILSRNGAVAHLSSMLKQATPVVVERGEGVHLYDEAGRRDLDFERVVELVVGSKADSRTDVGPLVDETAAARVESCWR